MTAVILAAVPGLAGMELTFPAAARAVLCSALTKGIFHAFTLRWKRRRRGELSL